MYLIQFRSWLLETLNFDSNTAILDRNRRRVAKNVSTSDPMPTHGRPVHLSLMDETQVTNDELKGWYSFAVAVFFV